MDYSFLLAFGGVVFGVISSYVAFKVTVSKDIEFIKHRLSKIEKFQDETLSKLIEKIT